MRTMKWSSTTRIRMGFKVGMGRLFGFSSNTFGSNVNTTCRCPRQVHSSLADRNQETVPRSRMSSKPKWPLLDSATLSAENPQPSSVTRRPTVFKIITQVKSDVLGVGMLDGIGNRLLADA